MVNAAGMIVGYGRIPPRPSDFYWFLGFDRRVDWQGHLKQTSLEGIKGFLAAGREHLPAVVIMPAGSHC
jgi:hypothetical protein